MPEMTFDLSNVDKTVSEAVLKSLAVQLRDQLNLNDVEEIRFIDHNGRVSTSNTFHGKKSKENDRFAQFDGRSRIWVETEESPSELSYGTMNYDLPDSPPIFFDRKLGVEIVPQSFGQDFTIKFKMTTPNRDEARRWHGLIMRRVHELKNGYQHTVDFSINLPPEVWLILELIWLYRERKEGYGESHLQYLKNHCSQDLTLVSEASGQKTNLTFTRRMARVNGLYRVAPFPEKPVYQDDNSIWECQLEYSGTYDRPQQCRMKYPIMVHNQLLPDLLLQMHEVTQSPVDASWERNLSMQGLGQHESLSQYRWNNKFDSYIRIPVFDNYQPIAYPKATAAIVMALAIMDEQDKATKMFFNLGELGDVRIDPDLLTFIREVEYEWLNKPFESFFNLGFYRNDDLVAAQSLWCTKELDICTSEDISLRDTYRVRLSLVIDPSLVAPAAFERLQRYPHLLEKYIIARNEAVQYDVDWVRGKSNWKLEKWMLDYEWWQINSMRDPSATNHSNTQGGGAGNADDRHQNENIPGWAWDLITGKKAHRTVGFNGIFAHRETR